MIESWDVQIGNALVDDLNSPDREWLRAFSARRLYRPVYAEDELKDLKVAVVMEGQEDPVALDRRHTHKWQYTVSVDFQQQVDGNDIPNMDALSKTAEQVQEFFLGKHRLPAPLDNFYVSACKRPDIYIWGQLYFHSIWETVLQLDVEGVR